MRDAFLIGRFLPAYGAVYRYRSGARPPRPSYAPEVLRDRFTSRAQRFRAKQNRYVLHLHLGLLAALVVVIAAFQMPIQAERSIAFQVVQQEIVTMEEIVQTRQWAAPPPPPRPQVPVEVPNDRILEDDELDLDASLDLDEPLAVGSLPPPPPREEEEEEPDENEIFVVVEQMPEIIGGLAAVAEDLEYPMIARQAGIEGLVVVVVTVDQEGRPTEPRVVKSVLDILDEAAVEAVMKQRFIPGRQRNRPVRVAFSIPVRFRLTGDGTR